VCMCVMMGERGSDDDACATRLPSRKAFAKRIQGCLNHHMSSMGGRRQGGKNEHDF